MSDSLLTIAAEMPVSSSTSRVAALSTVSLASRWPLGSDQMRGVLRPISKPAYSSPSRLSTKPPAERSCFTRPGRRGRFSCPSPVIGLGGCVLWLPAQPNALIGKPADLRFVHAPHWREQRQLLHRGGIIVCLLHQRMDRRREGIQ